MDRRGVDRGGVGVSAALGRAGSGAACKIGLSQAQFPRRFGFTLDTAQQYEQGRPRPSGPASALLRVTEADLEAVVRVARAKRGESSAPAPSGTASLGLGMGRPGDCRADGANIRPADLFGGNLFSFSILRRRLANLALHRLKK
jgi:hypothetical protein